MDEFYAGVAAGIFVAVITIMLIIGVFDAADTSSHKYQARQAIEQCEAQLPRHLNCEAVITAKVKEGE